MSLSNRLLSLFCLLFGLVLTAFPPVAAAQGIVPVHGLKVGDCVQFSNWNGPQKGTVAQAEYGGGYQVNWNGTTIPVGANSRDIQKCSTPATAPTPAPTPAATPTHTVTPATPHINTPAPTPMAEGGFKVGDCVQFSYGGGWETGTIAKPEVAGAYQVNWGAIVVPASGDPKNIRGCPAGTAAAGSDAATKAAMARLPKGTGIGAQYGTRNPATCTNRKVAITAATAKALLACDSEGVMGDILYLTTNATVQVGAARPFNYAQDSSAPAIDARQPVYDLHGSYTLYQCTALSEEPNDFAKTHNCLEYPATAGGYGRCYTDTSGDKRCIMTGGGPTQLKNQSPPQG